MKIQKTDADIISIFFLVCGVFSILLNLGVGIALLLAILAIVIRVTSDKIWS